jgi:hypothetical protein
MTILDSASEVLRIGKNMLEAAPKIVPVIFCETDLNPCLRAG